MGLYNANEDEVWAVGLGYIDNKGSSPQSLMVNEFGINCTIYIFFIFFCTDIIDIELNCGSELLCSWFGIKTAQNFR